MALIIDGFNLIYKFSDLEELMRRGRLSQARQGLVQKLKAYQELSGQKEINLVLDGKKEEVLDIKSERLGKGFTVHYSQYFSADALIQEFIEKEINPKMTTVVTSDKAIIDFARRHKAKVKKSEDFVRQVESFLKEHVQDSLPEKESDPVIDEKDIKYWEKIFKEDE